MPSRTSHPRIIKALSIRQPYASQIVHGEKFEEYRSRRTHFRGELLICASKSPRLLDGDGRPLPTGCAVAIVNVVGCRGGDDHWAWVLDNIQAIEPFAVRGRLGFYEVTLPADLELIGDPMKNPDLLGSGE